MLSILCAFKAIAIRSNKGSNFDRAITIIAIWVLKAKSDSYKKQLWKEATAAMTALVYFYT
jgi:hypothetical protein